MEGKGRRGRKVLFYKNNWDEGSCAVLPMQPRKSLQTEGNRKKAFKITRYSKCYQQVITDCSLCHNPVFACRPVRKGGVQWVHLYPLEWWNGSACTPVLCIQYSP